MLQEHVMWLGKQPAESCRRLHCRMRSLWRWVQSLFVGEPASVYQQTSCVRC